MAISHAWVIIMTPFSHKSLEKKKNSVTSRSARSAERVALFALTIASGSSGRGWIFPSTSTWMLTSNWVSSRRSSRTFACEPRPSPRLTSPWCHSRLERRPAMEKPPFVRLPDVLVRLLIHDACSRIITLNLRYTCAPVGACEDDWQWRLQPFYPIAMTPCRRLRLVRFANAFTEREIAAVAAHFKLQPAHFVRTSHGSDTGSPLSACLHTYVFMIMMNACSGRIICKLAACTLMHMSWLRGKN